MFKHLKSLACITALSLSATSYADLFEFDSGAGTSVNGTAFDNISASYDDQSNVLTWESNNFRNASGDVADGMWVVLNNGPNNPKGDDGLAIFYADFSDSDGAGNNDNSGLWAYEYNGQNNPNSYQNQDYLGDFSSSLINIGNVRGFSLDVSSIFANLASDQPFDENIGIWFHPTWGTQSVVSNNRLTDWSFNQQAWYDRAGQQSVVTVSEPTSFVLLLLGALGLITSRRKMK